MVGDDLGRSAGSIIVRLYKIMRVYLLFKSVQKITEVTSSPLAGEDGGGGIHVVLPHTCLPAGRLALPPSKGCVVMSF
jgi:hypothetical protein